MERRWVILILENLGEEAIKVLWTRVAWNDALGTIQCDVSRQVNQIWNSSEIDRVS